MNKKKVKVLNPITKLKTVFNTLQLRDRKNQAWIEDVLKIFDHNSQ